MFAAAAELIRKVCTVVSGKEGEAANARRGRAPSQTDEWRFSRRRRFTRLAGSGSKAHLKPRSSMYMLRLTAFMSCPLTVGVKTVPRNSNALPSARFARCTAALGAVYPTQH